MSATGLVYDRALHDRIGAVKHHRPSLSLIWKGMEHYLRRHRQGKKLHDPLAACCAIDERIGTWAEVEMYRDRGGWGARPATGTQTRIIVSYDASRFVDVLIGEESARPA